VFDGSGSVGGDIQWWGHRTMTEGSCRPNNQIEVTAAMGKDVGHRCLTVAMGNGI
jgi:hypothetical protein